MTPVWLPRRRSNIHPTHKPPIYVHVVHRPFAPRFTGRDGNVRWTFEIITDRFVPSLLHGTAPTKPMIYFRAYLAVRRYNKHAEYHMICRTRREPR